MKTWNLMHKWYAKRLLEAVIELSHYPKPYNTEPAKILYDRIVAVLKAYMRFENYDEHLFEDAMASFCNGDFIDNQCSPEKLSLLSKMTGCNIFAVSDEKYNTMFFNITLFEHRRDFFKAIMRYRLNMDIALKTWANIRLGDASVSYCAGMDTADHLAGYSVQEGAIALDKILVLLLGDRFDAVFTDDELRANFGYPEMSDGDLHRLLKRQNK